MFSVLKNTIFGRYQLEWKWSDSLLPSDWTTLTVAGPHGVKLSAILGVAKSKPRGVLVFAHPLTRAAKRYWLLNGQAEFYRKLGFHVVLFDFNGFGESHSHSFDFSGDINATGRHIKKRYPNLGVGLIGASFGAGWSVYALARKDHPYDTAILEGAFSHIPERYHHKIAYRTLRGLTRPIWPLIERNHFPVGYAKRIKNYPRVLLLHSINDQQISSFHSQRLQYAMADSAYVEFYQFENSKHNRIFIDQPDKYAAKVLPFLDSAFGKQSEEF